MEPYTGMRDILLGYDTDIHFENDDLMTTTGIDYIEREIYKLLITEPGDWKVHRNIGCTPNAFTGEQNSRAVGQKIEQYLISGLKLTVYPAQINVRVVPTDYTSVMIFIDILLQNYEIDSIPFEFDFINGIKKFDKLDTRVSSPVSSTSYKVNNIANMKNPNKYWAQLREERLTR
jgi:hypothetical protein